MYLIRIRAQLLISACICTYKDAGIVSVCYAKAECIIDGEEVRMKWDECNDVDKHVSRIKVSLCVRGEKNEGSIKKKKTGLMRERARLQK